MFTVQFQTSEGIWYLRGTIWTFGHGGARASYYETAGQARDALDKAKKFMHARFYKAARIVENV